MRLLRAVRFIWQRLTFADEEPSVGGRADMVSTKDTTRLVVK